MAPALVDTAPSTGLQRDLGNYKEVFLSGPQVFRKDIEEQGTATQPAARYQNYLPIWDPNEHHEPLVPFDHADPGKRADPTFPNLLKDAQVSDLTASIGAEVHGVQLSQLTEAGKNELALFVAQKKVVAFRGQDFADLSIPDALMFGSHFGRHHVHPTSGQPKGFPEIHLVHRGADDGSVNSFFQEHINSVTWHSDVTYEEQPPGTTFLYLLDGPTAGGDTLFANQAAAYRRLSPEFRRRLHGLEALHSGFEQAENSRARGSIVRRAPVANIHPIIRTHPVTGEKALFVNPQFTRKIIGLKKEESDCLLNFLYDHVAKGQDFQARVKWAPGTVVVWDNRVTAHSALLDWEHGARRHLARITPQAERPYETAFEG